RQRADAVYRFSDDYFRDLLAAPWCTAWAAETEGAAVAVACFLATAAPVAHYHLGGADAAGLDANAQYLLFETAFDHFAAAGARWLHLGGGRTPAPDDTLWQFKRRFSDVHARFCIGGLIHDPAAYRSLGGSRGGQFLGYRSPSLS
ncbi:MAG: GNAT family N-acetyltransferase, partial [Rhodospirillaceae bacterium]|nr:GNAT family N-acetyltransferase [Rhodospirillaceae bacterium]